MDEERSIFLFIYSKNFLDTKEYNELKKASETLKGKILMATSDIK